MRFQCNHCRALLELEDVEPGEIVQCPTCLSPVSIPDSVMSPRAVLGDFVIKEAIGNGGMGTVYLAHQVTLDRDVALKVLHPDFASDTVFIQNFINEARAAASLNHPNIVQAVAVNCDEGLWYFAMEYVNGYTLRQLLEQNGRIEEQQMLDIASEVVSALKYAWNEKHIVHRDIKPDNIILTSDGHAKLSDLGLARKITELNEDGSTELYGTPQYIAPELLYGAPPNAASDIYSFGATLYHTLSGRFPFMADSPEAVANLQLSAPLVPLKDIVPSISAPLSRLIDIMMVKSPEDRYHDYDELEQDLHRVHAGEMPLRQLPDAQQSTADSASSQSGKAKLKFKRNSRHAAKQENDGEAPQNTISEKTDNPQDNPKQEDTVTPPAVPLKSSMMLSAILAVLAIMIVAAAVYGVYFVIHSRQTTTSTITGTTQSPKTEIVTAPPESTPSADPEQKAAEEKAKAEAEEKARLEAEAKAAEEKARIEAEQKAKLEAEQKAKREAEEKARQEAEAKIAAEKAQQEAMLKAQQEAIAAEKARRIETAQIEVAARDFSGARQAFFSRINHETPQDKAWREQWEQALTQAESFWELLKESAPKIVNSEVNEFTMKNLRLKFLKSNHVEWQWTIISMAGDSIVLQREFETQGNDKQPVAIQWARKLQDLRPNQLATISVTIGIPEGKSEKEFRQALGLYLLVCGTAPAKVINEYYNLSDDWPYIVESASLISPKFYIDNQLKCIKERAEAATNATEPLTKTLFTIQAYDLGNALYMMFPNHKELYADEIQQVIKPLLSTKK